jgi:hypothetical protein
MPVKNFSLPLLLSSLLLHLCACTWNLERCDPPCPVIEDIDPEGAKAGDQLTLLVSGLQPLPALYELWIGNQLIPASYVSMLRADSVVCTIPALPEGGIVSLRLRKDLYENQCTERSEKTFTLTYYYTVDSNIIFTGTPGETDCPDCLNRPAGLALDNKGNLWIADRFHNQIRKTDIRGNIIQTFGRRDTSGCTDIPASFPSAAIFKNPVDVTADASGGALIADGGSSTIRKIKSDNDIRLLIGQCSDFSGMEGDCRTATLSSPLRLIAEGNTGWLIDGRFVRRINNLNSDCPTMQTVFEGNPADFMANTVAINRDISGNALLCLSGSKGQLKTFDPETGTLRDISFRGEVLSRPIALTTDGNGVLFIADQDNKAVLALYPDKTLRHLADVTLTQFSGMAFDAGQKALYISCNDHVIRKLILR